MLVLAFVTAYSTLEHKRDVGRLLHRSSFSSPTTGHSLAKYPSVAGPDDHHHHPSCPTGRDRSSPLSAPLLFHPQVICDLAPCLAPWPVQGEVNELDEEDHPEKRRKSRQAGESGASKNSVETRPSLFHGPSGPIFSSSLAWTSVVSETHTF